MLARARKGSRAALRWGVTLALVGAGLFVAGCGSGEGPSALLSAGAATVDPGDGGGTQDRGSANPFGDRTAEALATREVVKYPSTAEIMKPVSSLPEMALGRADAPVTIIKYASMTCPYCRQFQIEVFPELKRHYIDTGKVRFILREFPIGFQSGAATIALRCAPPARYFELYDKLMRQQSVWVSQEVRSEPILKVAAQVGVTRDQLDGCLQDKTLVKELNAIKERGRTLGIVGTPNFFINGRLIKSVLTLKDVKAIIDPQVAGKT